MSAAVKNSGEAATTPGRSNLVDAKREEFRKYLEKEGILESLTKALVSLYEEPDKPNDALGYLKNNFAGHGALVTELRTVKIENAQLKQKVETLEKEKFLLKDQVSSTEAKLKAALEKTEEKAKDKAAEKPAEEKEETKAEEEAMETEEAPKPEAKSQDTDADMASAPEPVKSPDAPKPASPVKTTEPPKETTTSPVKSPQVAAAEPAKEEAKEEAKAESTEKPKEEPAKMDTAPAADKPADKPAPASAE